jgi:hypothetical protein
LTEQKAPAETIKNTKIILKKLAVWDDEWEKKPTNEKNN